jgi:phosphoribosylaminoimidazole-succinocarboxamide synthase
MKAIYQTDFPALKLVHRGKVRDIYDLGEFLLFVATDRISAFDVIMDTPVPGKGEILSRISTFWFDKTKHIISNHLVTSNPDDYPVECHQYNDDLINRSMLVRKCKPLPIEAVVRGYIAGSGWKEYQKSGTVSGITIPAGLLEFEKLPEVIFTPTTKEEVGHDQSINFEKMSQIVGLDISEQVRDIAIKLYNFAWEYLNERGLILADTKFEFGLNEEGELILIDEALTPDSSRFWLKDVYSPGKPQYNFDKQVLRDYLESIKWNKTPPPPILPNEIIKLTIDKYTEAFQRIVNGDTQ